VTQFNPLDRSDRYKFDISKIQVDGGCYPEKIKKSPYVGRNRSDLRNVKNRYIWLPVLRRPRSYQSCVTRSFC